jgi:hypothetical protein
VQLVHKVIHEVVQPLVHKVVQPLVQDPKVQPLVQDPKVQLLVQRTRHRGHGGGNCASAGVLNIDKIWYEAVISKVFPQ